MRVNEAVWDRAIRVVAGLVLLYLGWGGVVAGTSGTVFKFLGFLPLLTGIIGFCPAYPLLGIRTKKA
jgi:Protein of unknown function (DUF2892)